MGSEVISVCTPLSDVLEEIKEHVDLGHKVKVKLTFITADDDIDCEFKCQDCEESTCCFGGDFGVEFQKLLHDWGVPVEVVYES